MIAVRHPVAVAKRCMIYVTLGVRQSVRPIDVQKFFNVFLHLWDILFYVFGDVCGHVFYVFNVFFYFPNVFFIYKKRWQSLQRQAD